MSIANKVEQERIMELIQDAQRKIGIASRTLSPEMFKNKGDVLEFSVELESAERGLGYIAREIRAVFVPDSDPAIDAVGQ